MSEIFKEVFPNVIYFGIQWYKVGFLNHFHNYFYHMVVLVFVVLFHKVVLVVFKIVY